LGWGAALLSSAPGALAQPEAVGASPAPAPSTYALSWVRAQGAEECPSGHALALEVERRLGRPVFDAAAARSFEVQVTRVAGVFHSDVFVRDESGKAIGQRELRSDEPGCSALFGATALAIALVIDPEAANRDPGASAAAAFEAPAPPPAPTAVAPPAPPVASPPPPDRPPVPLPPAAAQTAVTFSLRAQISGGLVPAASPGLGLAFSARPGERWGLSVSGWYTAPQAAETALPADLGSQNEQSLANIEVGLTRATVAVTFDVARSRRLRLLLAGGPSLGAFHVAVREPTPITDAGDFWFVAAELGVGLQVAVSEGIFLEMGGAALVPIRLQEFLARGQPEPLWREPRVAGMGFLGFGALFP
jgi:hypothetical protein